MRGLVGRMLSLKDFYIYLFPITALISAATDGTARIFFLPPYTAALGFYPTSVSRVAPDWDLSDALPTELISEIIRGAVTVVVTITKAKIKWR